MQPRRQFLRMFDQLIARLNAIYMRGSIQGFEKQIVQNKTQIGLPCPMIHQLNILTLLQNALQQRCDELIEVVDLLELAAGILIHPAVAS